MPDPDPEKATSSSSPFVARLKRVALLAIPVLFAWSPALITGILIDRHSLNIPVWDDFERANLVEKYHRETLDWNYLVSPHIEHRILVPRLITLANCAVGSGDLRNEIWINFAAMLISSLCIALLVLRSRGRRPTSWFLIFLCNLCIFSLIQYQNLLWAVQTAFFLPLTFLCLSLLVLHSPLRLRVRFSLAILCAIAASFSFSHGLVVWPVVLGYLLLSPATGSPRKRAIAVSAGTVIAAAVFAFYFHDLSSTSHTDHSYGQEEGQPSFGLEGLKTGETDPGKVGTAFLTGAGSQFSRFVFGNPVHLAPIAGIALILLYFAAAAAGLAICFRRKNAIAWGNLLPWLALGGYVLAAVLAIALGRSHFSMYRTLSPRYITVSLYLPVALVVLTPMVISLFTGGSKYWPAIRQTGIVAGVLFFGLQSWNWLYGYHGLKAWHASRWQSLIDLTFRDYGEPEYPFRIDFDTGFAREQTDRLKAMGFLHRIPEPYRPGDFSRFKISSKILGGKKAGIGRTEFQPEEEQWRIEGFADVRTKMGRVPDGIVFTIGEETSRTIVGFGEIFPQVPFYISEWDFEFARLNLQTAKSQTAWSANLRLSDLPENTAFPTSLNAWAIDFRINRVYQIGEPVILEKPES